MRKPKWLVITLLVFIATCMLLGLWQFRWPGVISGFLFAIGLALFGAAVAMRERNAKFRDIALRYHAVFESNVVGLISTELTGRIKRANNYFLNMIGYSREEFEKRPISWQQLTPPEIRQRTYEAIDECVAHGSARPFEKEYIRKNGARVPVLVGMVHAKPHSIVTFVIDITERKAQELLVERIRENLEEIVEERTEALRAQISAREKTNQEIRESKTFLDSVIENIPNMIFVKSADELRFLRFNRAGEEIIGRSRSEMIGKNDYDFFPKEQADFFTAKDRMVLQGKKAIDIPEEPISTSKGIRILHTKKIPVFSDNGTAQYLLGISEDITEKKAAELARISLLREQAARREAERSAQQLRFFGHASNALSESLDLDSMLMAFSRVILSNLAKVVRIDLIQDEGEPRRIIVPSASPIPQRFERMIRAALASGKLERANEGENSMLVMPLESHGKVLGTLGLLSNAATKPYGDYEVSLVKDLARRAAFAVENATLFIKAQEANRAKSAFLANMSHEIRTPLGAMLGFADLLAESADLRPDQAEHVSTILRNGRQLLRIVDEILDLSKVESERMEVEKIPFSLPKLLDETMDLLEIRARKKGLALKLETEKDVPTAIVTDPTRLRQILLNVVGNAIKFTSKGWVDVRVAYRKGIDGKNVLAIEVQDSGIGITKEQKERLFQPFVQADDSTSRKYGGTGLGLVLARKLARLLGGDLRLAESIPGRGSRFIITVHADPWKELLLPSSPPQDGASSRKKPRTEGGQEKSALGKKRLLVVDDSDDNRLLVGHHLKRMGLPLEVDFAEAGDEGVRKALANRYDLVLMDIQMPNMDGFEAVRELRKEGYREPVIALTAHAMKGYRERCISAGFTDYICKPIQKEILFQALIDYGMGAPPVGRQESELRR